MSSIFRRLFYAISYLGAPPWDTGISPPELLDFIRTHTAGSALDLGCGTGTNLMTLAENGWKVCGIDFSNRAVNTARRRLGSLGIPTKVFNGDVSRQLFPGNNFDLILDIGCYHDLSQPDRDGYRSNINRWLAPGGTFLIYAHCLTPDRSKATGVTQVDIDEFSKIMRMERIVRSHDRWDRESVWMTFVKPR